MTDRDLVDNFPCLWCKSNIHTMRTCPTFYGSMWWDIPSVNAVLSQHYQRPAEYADPPTPDADRLLRQALGVG